MFNWTSYNESLVRRGEVILDFDIIDGWYVELERMNEGKRGATYGYPNSFVQLLGYVKAYYHIDKLTNMKIHVAVDIKKKRILSLEVTSEEVHDGKMLRS